LISILGEKDLSKLPARVQRFKLRLMRYDYSIFHIPGSKMFIADFLSRPNNPRYPTVDIAQCNLVEEYVSSLVDVDYVDCMQEDIYKALRDDLESKQLLSYMSCGWPIRKANMSKETAKLYAVRDNLSLCKGLILYNSRIYVPKPLRSAYLEKCHEGHQGITKCRRRAQRHFWWPGVSKEIACYVERCSTCIKHRDIKHQPMIESELPSAPWMVIGSDIFTFEKQLYLVVKDYYSK